MCVENISANSLVIALRHPSRLLSVSFFGWREITCLNFPPCLYICRHIEIFSTRASNLFYFKKFKNLNKINLNLNLKITFKDNPLQKC